MAFSLVQSLSSLLFLVALSRAQFGQQQPNLQQRYFASGSEGPCGFNARTQQPVGSMPQPAVPQRPPVNAPQQGFGQQSTGPNPQPRRFIRQAPGPNPQPAFNPQPQPPQQAVSGQRNANLPGFNPNSPWAPISGPMTLADALGLPAGMTPNQAHHLEIDVHNPYDLDVPEPGAPGTNPAMNIPATGIGARLPHNLPATYPYNQPAANSFNLAQKPGPFAVRSPPNQYGAPHGFAGGVFPYAPRMNCQCETAGDCNRRAFALGMRFNHECRHGFVCCCRTG